MICQKPHRQFLDNYQVQKIVMIPHPALWLVLASWVNNLHSPTTCKCQQAFTFQFTVFTIYMLLCFKQQCVWLPNMISNIPLYLNVPRSSLFNTTSIDLCCFQIGGIVWITSKNLRYHVQSSNRFQPFIANKANHY